jgi:hypothetical protein
LGNWVESEGRTEEDSVWIGDGIDGLISHNNFTAGRCEGAHREENTKQEIKKNMMNA